MSNCKTCDKEPTIIEHTARGAVKVAGTYVQQIRGEAATPECRTRRFEVCRQQTECVRRHKKSGEPFVCLECGCFLSRKIVDRTAECPRGLWPC